MKIVSFFNVKGGVGKPTLTILTAIALSKEGSKVLIIDADTQANLTQFLYKVSHDDKTMFDGLADNIIFICFIRVFNYKNKSRKVCMEMV